MTQYKTYDLIDAFLTDVTHQSLIDGDKVRDLLLDLRQAFANDLVDAVGRVR